MEINRVIIIPTGDEIREGIVRDIDSPEILSQTLAVFPRAQVTRVPPVLDVENQISGAIQSFIQDQPDLIVLIGGSGGGHRFSQSLGKDFTHSALSGLLDQYSSREIYGKNGHMWCKLICGQKKGTILINVPGPFVEAKAAYGAFLRSWLAGLGQEEINQQMAEAVFTLYPGKADRVQSLPN